MRVAAPVYPPGRGGVDGSRVRGFRQPLLLLIICDTLDYPCGANTLTASAS